MGLQGVQMRAAQYRQRHPGGPPRPAGCHQEQLSGRRTASRHLEKGHKSARYDGEAGARQKRSLLEARKEERPRPVHEAERISVPLECEAQR